MFKIAEMLNIVFLENTSYPAYFIDGSANYKEN